MQANPTYTPTAGPSLTRSLSWFLMPPLVTMAIIGVVLAALLVSLEARYRNRIYPGVSVSGVTLDGATPAEAAERLTEAAPYASADSIVLHDPATDEVWIRSPAEMGLRLDTEATVEAAMSVGREGDPWQQLREQLHSWYYGRPVAPVLVFDEGQLDRAIAALAAEVDRPAVDAALDLDGNVADNAPAQIGRALDRADLRRRLLAPLTGFQPVEIELLVHEIPPQIVDAMYATNQIGQIVSSPITFYFQEPLDGVDLGRVSLSTEQLRSWLRVQLEETTDGKLRHEVFVDEVAVREWLRQYEDEIYREPVNARFYFDDPTRQLVLVEPHINGRFLNVEATAARFAEQVVSGNRSVPFIVEPIVPEGHAGVTAEELGITELVAESTTWFYGSSAERKHNIARSAANFYGILVAPGEEFSFNKYLGNVSEEEGYETGLIIFGGRTIEGVGGGVCQVSTTLFQAAFWGGFPINERWEHGYQVGYYNDGEGPGMDATVFSPLVDLRFTNNTAHYLLIENYYNEIYQSLTFKIYSTDIGRTVEKTGPFFENVQPPKPDLWEYNEELAPGEIRQVDWAVEGADVTVTRKVTNFQGDVLIDEAFTSHYIPWQNIYEYGPGVDPNNLPPDWEEQLEEH